MKNLWKMNSTIFLLQWLGYFVADGFLNEGNIGEAKVVEAIIAAGVAVSAIVLGLVGESLSKEINPLTIISLAVASAILQFPRDLVPGTADHVMIITAFFLPVIAVGQERKQGESIIACYATAIPAIGIPVGAMILLFQWLCRPRGVSAT